MSDDDRTREQLLEEVHALRRELDQRNRPEPAEGYLRDVLAGLLSLTSEELDAGIDQALERIARHTRTACSSLVLVSDDGQTVTNTHEWCADPADSQQPLLQNVPADVFGRASGHLRAGREVRIEWPADLPVEAADEPAWAEKLSFRAALFVPLMRGAVLVGMLGVSCGVGESRQWSDRDVSSLKLTGSFLVNLLERRRAESELRSERTFSESVLDAIHETVYVFDPHTLRALFWNRAMTVGLGYGDDEIREMLAASEAYYAEEDLPRLAAATRRVLAEGSTRLEARLRAKDGTLIPFSYSAVLIPGRTGQPAVCVVGRDERERHRAERARDASETENRAIVEAMPDLLFCLSPDGTHERFNVPRGEEAFVRPEEIIGRRVADILPAPVAEQYLAQIAQTLERQSIQIFEYELDFADDDRRYYEARMVPQGSERVLVLVRNVTERHRDAAERSRLEAQLHQAQKMEAIGTLAGGVAHDMNNILGGIMMFAGLLAVEGGPRPSLSEEVRGIIQLCKRGSKLTRDLLGFARKGQHVKIPVSVVELVGSVSSLVRRTVPRTIEVALDLDERASYVTGDPDQLSAALMNLCLNAVDAMGGRGTLRIKSGLAHLDEERVAGTPELAPGDFVCLQVEDTGDGMDERTLARALEPFFTTKAPGKGSGLGLSMAYGTVRNHGGLLTIDSGPGVGTTVSVYLPRADASASRYDLRPTPLARRQPGAGRVLVIDDEAAICFSVKRILEARGHEVVVAANGQAALSLCDEYAGSFVLVLLDLTMPVMDGAEVFRVLHAQFPEIPILLASGHSREGQADELLRAGAAGFIQKPFGAEQLLTALDEALVRRVIPG